METQLATSRYGNGYQCLPGRSHQPDERIGQTPLINPGPTRLNPSFGAITYAQNDRRGNYNALIFDVRGHFSRGYIDASYTRSSSKDDGLDYPDSENFNPNRYYGPSIFDVPNRFSLEFQLFVEGIEWRTRCGRLSDGRMGNQRNQHLPVWISVNRRQ